MESGSGKESDASELGPAFALEAPTDTGIDEMLEVIQHPTRSKILDALAAKTLTTENLEFIRAGVDDRHHTNTLEYTPSHDLESTLLCTLSHTL